MKEQDLSDIDIYAMEEGDLETQNRLRNLMWTVSGDYTLDTALDVAAFRQSKEVSFYDAVKQGAFAAHYDKDALALYLLKKIHLGAQRSQLTDIAQLCVGSAVYPYAVTERPGVEDIRESAFAYLLSHRFQSLNQTWTGKVKLAFMRGSLSGDWRFESRIANPLRKVRSLEEQAWEAVRSGAEADTMTIIQTVDELYNQMIDPHFAAQHGSLEQVLAVSMQELNGDDWRQFLKEEADEVSWERLAQNMTRAMTATDSGDDEEREASVSKRRVINIDEEAVEKIYSYIEKNFGRSYLSEKENKALNYRLCKGAHADCSLYYTEGIIQNPVMRNAQYVHACKSAGDNERYYREHRRVTRQNIQAMTSFLKRALQLRSERDQQPSDHGSVIPNRVWRVGRVNDPGKLFWQTTRQHQNDFAVVVLMDGSGSQNNRQAQVALEAYILSCALSGAGFPHEIMSFCTFWEYTVMQRYRRFDDPVEADKTVLQFTTSSNNRDGLAIRAAGDALLERPEENKILIVLSDGRPNDVIIGRPGSRNPHPYTGEYALRDTAHEIRVLRGQDIRVLGVFTGIEKDLMAEKRIFGKDFAYIRTIQNFSKVVSAYLARLLEQDVE